MKNSEIVFKFKNKIKILKKNFIPILFCLSFQYCSSKSKTECRIMSPGLIIIAHITHRIVSTSVANIFIVGTSNFHSILVTGFDRSGHICFVGPTARGLTAIPIMSRLSGLGKWFKLTSTATFQSMQLKRIAESLDFILLSSISTFFASHTFSWGFATTACTSASFSFKRSKIMCALEIFHRKSLNFKL